MASKNPEHEDFAGLILQPADEWHLKIEAPQRSEGAVTPPRIINRNDIGCVKGQQVLFNNTNQLELNLEDD